MPKASSVSFRLDQVEHLPVTIWNDLAPYNTNTWGLPQNQASLAAIAGTKETNDLYTLTDKATQNIELRKLLYQPLRDTDFNVRARAIRWIVVEWGRIVKASADVVGWAHELKTYSDIEVRSFIENHKKRVSSWSKVLAFADSTKYAIFDSRVAMTLNGMLDSYGRNERFHMPSSRDDGLNEVFSHVKAHVDNVYKGRRNKYVGYEDYLLLLHKIAEKGNTNILEIEMMLFDNSERWEQIYKNKYNLA